MSHISPCDNKHESVHCTHCDKLLQVRTARRHIIDYWDADNKTWKKTRNGQPHIPTYLPDMRILTRSQVSEHFEHLFVELGIPSEQWMRFGHTPRDPRTVVSRKRQRPSRLAINDRKVEQKSALNGLDIDGDMELPNHPRVPSKPLLNLRPSRLTKFWMALKAWQLTYRISLAALNALLLVITTFSDILMPRDYDDIEELSSEADTMTMYLLNRELGIGERTDEHFFSTYSWCNKCSSIYTTDQVTLGGGAFLHPCRSVLYPRHPHRNKRAPCNTTLGSYRIINGSRVYKPHTPYHYRPLLSQLAAMYRRPHFEEQVEHWRNRSCIDGHWSDVYDGEMWQKYSSHGNVLSEPGSLAFLLNVDWFNPFTRGNFSCGAVYLTILNLPRHLRYKKENMILLCLLPGGKEKPQDLSKLLAPFVAEMQLLWTGTIFNTVSCPNGALVRGMLLVVSCDLPAARKLAGFKSDKYCCSRCHKAFEAYDSGRLDSIGQKVWLYDKSGSDWENWVHRTEQEVRTASDDYKDCATPSAQQSFVTEHCVRFSILNELPYWDAVNQVVFDPMHCLWMGVAKHVITKWKDNKVINSVHMATMEKKLRDLSTTRRYGRMRSKIDGNMSQFTAEEMKMFTIVYSLWLLKPILPSDHYVMWRHFVKAVTTLSRPVLNEVELQKAQEELVEFTKCYDKLDIFGPRTWVPNMHFMFHIQDDIRNFGPTYGYHLFALERFNGILEGVATDQRTPQTTYMRHITHAQALFNYPTSSDPDISFTETELRIWKSLTRTHTTDDICPPIDAKDLMMWHRACNAELKLNGSEEFGAQLLNPVKRKGTVSQGAMECRIPVQLGRDLEIFLKTVYPTDYPSKIKLPYMITKYKRLRLFGREVGSLLWNKGKGNHILARFLRTRHRGTDLGTMFAGYVDFFFSIDLIRVRSDRIRTSETHRFAYCSWYKPRTHATELIDSIWQRDVYARTSGGTEAVIPLYAIASEFIPGPLPNGDFCILVLPNQMTVWSPDEYEYHDEL